MAGLDIICIGAINYDYMFHCTGLDLVETSAGGGDENLSNPISDVENDIQELAIKGKEYTTQIGGSAFITLKVAKHILPNLQVAYVACAARPVHSICASARQMTLTPSWRTWITVTGCLPRASAFDDPYSKAIAKSIVRLYNHTRNCIKIAPCANNTLLDRIHEQEARTGTTLAEYLAQARWIHLSSLSDFDQFEAIMQSVIQAKHLNPAMKVSMDPGFEYTSLRRERLQPLIAYADYVFLNKSEKKNLGFNARSARPLYANLCEYFSAINPDPTRTLIVKHDDRHELIHFKDGVCQIRTVRHKKLYQYQLNNDTGAGDSFAGGFISGMLDDRLNSDIAEPIQLGVLAAKGRMRSFDYENPYLNIQKLTDAFFEAL